MRVEAALEAVEETRKWMKTAWGTDAPLDPIITAIKSLEQQPCEDAVSRKAVINIFGLTEMTTTAITVVQIIVSLLRSGLKIGIQCLRK